MAYKAHVFQIFMADQVSRLLSDYRVQVFCTTLPEKCLRLHDFYSIHLCDRFPEKICLCLGNFHLQKHMGWINHVDPEALD